MKRKTLIVLLVLLLVGILAFTVFACNDNNKKPDNPGTDTPGGDGPGPDDENPPEEETYAITEALPKLVTGLDKVAATVGDINSGEKAYLGADIGLVLGVTAEGVKAIDLDLGLSLKVSVDNKTVDKNWALIGLTSGNDEIAQLFIHAEAANKEVIYIKESLTGNDNWKRLSVLDTSAPEDGLTGLFTTPGGVEPDANYNDEGVAGFDTETGYHHVYSGGLIGRLFGLIDVMTNGTKVGEEYMFAKPVYKTEGTGDDEHEVFVGYAPEGGAPVIDFTADSPIGGLKIMGDTTISGIVNLVGMLDKLVDGALHAEAYDNGNRYVATLNREGIGNLIGGLMDSFDLGGLLTTLENLNPVLRLVLGMEVKDGKFNVLNYNNPDDAPELDIEFSVDPDSAALTDLAINFANGDIEGLGIDLGLALSNIELSGESKDPAVETAGAETPLLGINLDLEAKLPAWGDNAATIAVSIDPAAKIGWDEKGKVKIDLSDIKGYATFNGKTIAEYCTYTIGNEAEKGFAIDLGAVYDFIEPLEDVATATDLRDNIYFIKCDLDEIVYTAMYPNNGSGANNLSNAAYANEDEATGALAKLISAIKAGVSLNNINNVIGPILTDSNNLVGLLLGLFDGPITLDPALGEEDVDGSIKVTADLAELVQYVMNDNLLGGIEDMINISMYDVSAASTEGSNEDKTPYTLSQILDGQTDLVDVIIDLVYTATYEAAKKDGKATEGFNAYITSLGDSLITREKVVAYAKNLGITLDKSVTAADFGDLVAAITYGEKGLSASISILGATLSLSADLDEYVDVADSIIGADAGVKVIVITSWAEFNAKNSLQNALMELAGYAMLNIEAETPAA